MDFPNSHILVLLYLIENTIQLRIASKIRLLERFHTFSASSGLELLNGLFNVGAMDDPYFHLHSYLYFQESWGLSIDHSSKQVYGEDLEWIHMYGHVRSL